jgi:hypothetical protein
MTYTHEELAARTTTERAQTSRILTGLDHDRVIELKPSEHRIIVLDPDRLTEDE